MKGFRYHFSMSIYNFIRLVSGYSLQGLFVLALIPIFLNLRKPFLLCTLYILVYCRKRVQLPIYSFVANRLCIKPCHPCFFVVHFVFSRSSYCSYSCLFLQFDSSDCGALAYQPLHCSRVSITTS